jgi:hypothetical protein
MVFAASDKLREVSSVAEKLANSTRWTDGKLNATVHGIFRRGCFDSDVLFNEFNPQIQCFLYFA